MDRGCLAAIELWVYVCHSLMKANCCSPTLDSPEPASLRRSLMPKGWALDAHSATVRVGGYAESIPFTSGWTHVRKENCDGHEEGALERSTGEKTSYVPGIIQSRLERNGKTSEEGTFLSDTVTVGLVRSHPYSHHHVIDPIVGASCACGRSSQTWPHLTCRCPSHAVKNCS